MERRESPGSRIPGESSQGCCLWVGEVSKSFSNDNEPIWMWQKQRRNKMDFLFLFSGFWILDSLEFIPVPQLRKKKKKRPPHPPLLPPLLPPHRHHLHRLRLHRPPSHSRPHGRPRRLH